MVSMRQCAGLVLVGLAVAAATPSAHADTYCAGPGTNPDSGGPCDTTVAGIQEALDAATANPGPDVVLIPEGKFDFASGLHYSDGGQAGNGVTIQGAPQCERICGGVEIHGGAPGGALLSFGGGGGAAVKVNGLQLFPGTGATGLVLPPGAEASGHVYGPTNSTGVRVEGTAANPAIFRGGIFSEGVAVDAPGHGILLDAYVEGGVGARIRGDGFLDIRRGQITAPVGVTGSSARLIAVILLLEKASPGGDPPVGVEAICAGPDSADAEIALTNVTLNGLDAPNGTGARAVARGGDGESCNATVQLNSTVIHRVTTALDAHGETGAGADASDGLARIRPQYSAFDPSRTASTAPADLDTSGSGGNVFEDPHFYPDVFGSLYMYWDSPLIDRGDPAEPEPWQQAFIAVIHGRRDIGRYEYRFEPPGVRIEASSLRITPEGFAHLVARAYDNDPGDGISVRWQLSDGTTSTDREVFRDYGRVGRYTERVIVVDSTGLSAQDSITITVAKQRVMGLTIDPTAFSASRRPRKGGATRTTIGYALAVPGRIRFRVERAVRVRARHPHRWVRVPGRLSRPAQTGHAALGWGGWIGGRRLRPGLYRLVASASAGPLNPPTGPPRRVRFRVIR